MALPAFAAGCGFSPVYGPGGTATALYGKVWVADPTDQESYLYVQKVEQTLGQTQAPDYKLTYKIRTRVEGQAVTTTGDTTRYNLIGRVDYVLSNESDDTVVTQGYIENFVGYSATGSTVDTLSAERDAVRRLMVILADRTTEQLFLTADLSE